MTEGGGLAIHSPTKYQAALGWMVTKDRNHYLPLLPPFWVLMKTNAGSVMNHSGLGAEGERLGAEGDRGL